MNPNLHPLPRGEMPFQTANHPRNGVAVGPRVVGTRTRNQEQLSLPPPRRDRPSLLSPGNEAAHLRRRRKSLEPRSRRRNESEGALRRTPKTRPKTVERPASLQ